MTSLIHTFERISWAGKNILSEIRFKLDFLLKPRKTHPHAVNLRWFGICIQMLHFQEQCERTHSSTVFVKGKWKTRVKKNCFPILDSHFFSTLLLALYVTPSSLKRLLLGEVLPYRTTITFIITEKAPAMWRNLIFIFIDKRDSCDNISIYSTKMESHILIEKERYLYYIFY